jgi:transcriptional regulator with XRE-family HTH domain
MLGISQKQIAKVLGVTIQQVQKYGRSKNRISSGKLHAIAILFGMPITSFFSLNQAYLEN